MLTRSWSTALGFHHYFPSVSLLLTYTSVIFALWDRQDLEQNFLIGLSLWFPSLEVGFKCSVLGVRKRTRKLL